MNQNSSQVAFPQAEVNTNIYVVSYTNTKHHDNTHDAKIMQ